MEIVRKFKKLLMMKLITRYVLPDKIYYQYCYFIFFGKWFSYKNPVGFNAKIQWLKANNRDERLIYLTDKLVVRDYIKETIGEKYLVPLIGFFSNVNEINWESLPMQFVLKVNHGSGWNIICDNKSELDIRKAKRKLKKWLNKNFYFKEKEWQYKSITPHIICEKHLAANNAQLFDIKLFCYNGIPEFIIYYPSQAGFRNIYYKNWKRVDCETKYKQGPDLPKPENLQLIFDLASRLSKGFPFIRVDFLLANNRIYFGELTFTPSIGFYRFKPKKYDLVFGEPIRLPVE